MSIVMKGMGGKLLVTRGYGAVTQAVWDMLGATGTEAKEKFFESISSVKKISVMAERKVVSYFSGKKISNTKARNIISTIDSLKNKFKR